MPISNFLLSLSVYSCVNAHYKFRTIKGKINLLVSKANCSKQCQSIPVQINFHLLECALKIQKLRSRIGTLTSFATVS